ncbi:hypothetical protein EDD15DRAFT_2195641 [Pisolithus albus]|nr:hypothetical protein EDD15DRAFT_2195641 [Pisolithus albus]
MPVFWLTVLKGSIGTRNMVLMRRYKELPWWGGLSPYIATLHAYNLESNTWKQCADAPGEPHGGTSIALVAFPSLQEQVVIQSGNGKHTNNVPIALLYYGEKAPSSLGHARTSKFWDDVWALISFPASSFETAMTEWKMLDTVGLEKPAPCGWFLSSSYVSPEGKTHIVLTGGLLSTNECSGEVWVGDIQF